MLHRRMEHPRITRTGGDEMSDAYADFERDVPDHLREDVMTMLAESSHIADAHDCITILDRDEIDAINCRAHGIIEIEGIEYTFQIEDGNWNGTVLLDWNGDRAFEHHVPTKWALQPSAALVGDALANDRGKFLVAKWDAMLARDEIASIPGNYSYDRRFAPGLKTEAHYRESAAKHHFVIVAEDQAAETRKALSA